MDRRGFLGSLLALGAAPAIVRSESLMRLWVPERSVLTIDEVKRDILRLADREFNLAEITLTIDEFSACVIRPAIRELAKQIDDDAMNTIRIRMSNPYRLAA